MMQYINFPLLLVVLVIGSGVIWLIDTLVFKNGREEILDKLRLDWPNWAENGSSDQQAFYTAADNSAREPVLVEYSRSLFPVLAIVLILRSFVVEPFQIPSGSMIPTLEVGDFILVNKFTYGLRLPVVRTKVLDIKDPQRGDVMVFFPPHVKQYYIKRVIGVPGDIIEYKNKTLTINGEPQPEELLESGTQYMRTSEVLNGVEHSVQKKQSFNRMEDFSVKVRPGHYFMMGDNRDNSLDSRSWGQVPEANIVGRAFAIWMHWEKLLSLPSFDRVGKVR